jgi:hypothetical protein
MPWQCFFLKILNGLVWTLCVVLTWGHIPDECCVDQKIEGFSLVGGDPVKIPVKILLDDLIWVLHNVF